MAGQKEGAPKKPLFFVYRDNDLYAATVPALVEALRKDGHEVDVHVFPRGTGEEEIAGWMGENVDEIKGKELVNDGTVARSISSDRSIPGTREAFLTLHNAGVKLFGIHHADGVRKQLDDLFAWTAMGVLQPKKPVEAKRNWQPTMEQSKQAFVDVFHRILAKVEPPSHVYLSRRLMAGHDPFSYETDESDAERDEEANNDRAVADFTACLLEVGITCPVTVVESVKSIPEGDSASWVLYDRHENNPATRMRVFRIPLGNLVEDAARAGLLDIRPEELQDALIKRAHDNFK